MTESNENKKTLKLGSNTKLTLSKSTDSSEIKHNFGRGKSRTVTVEVKKSKNLPKDNKHSEAEALFKVATQPSSKEALDPNQLTEGERLTRLQALQTANKQLQTEKKQKELIEAITPEDSDISPSSITDHQAVTTNNFSTLTEKQTAQEAQTSEASIAKPLESVKKTSNEEIDISVLDEEDSKGKKPPKGEKKPSGLRSSLEEKWGNKYHLGHLTTPDEDLESDIDSVRPYIKKPLKNKKSNQPFKKEKIIREVIIPDNITVQELSSRMAERSITVIKELMKLGVTATIDHTIDADTAELITTSLGHVAKRVSDTDIEKDFELQMSREGDKGKLLPRAPIVTVMGHVDHGKTSLLDAMRSTNIALSEAGGITQHIGAYKITTQSGREIVFLDTPGHEAFTAIRSRGAQCTDIVILVVAADDGVMPQTIEAINHAKAAGVAMIVAINKIDRPNANPTKVKSELLSYEVVLEEFGGNVLAVEISAKEKIGLKELEEAILMQAEFLELTANPNRQATGTVLEAKIDKGKGIVTNVLVQNGTLKVGDIVITSMSYGKVKRIIDDKGKSLNKATPSTPVEIIGLNTIAEPGYSFVVLNDEKKAKELIDFRSRKEQESKFSNLKRSSIEDLFASSGGKIKELCLIIKTDSHGSREAINASLGKFAHEELRIKILHLAIGAITESDVNLGKVGNAIILGFNVKAEANARTLAEKNGIDIRYYSIIYNLLDDVKALLSGLLSPIIREAFLGTAEFRQIFDITKFGKIAGSYVTKGVIKRGAYLRLIRNNIVIHEGILKTLKRFKDDVKEAKEGYECGIGVENYSDIRVGDIVEVFERIQEKRKL
jgi:translation initiation factor IF-2